MNKIFVIGEILIEMMAEKKDQTFSQSGNFSGPYASGAPAIFIDQVARFGIPAAIISAVGNDDFGKMCLTRLKEDGVDIKYVKTVQNIPTGVAFVRYNGDGSRNFIFHLNNAACGRIIEEDLDKIDLLQASVFHIMGSSIFNDKMVSIHEKMIKMIPKNCIISFDPNIRPEIISSRPELKRFISDIFRKSEILFVTREELEFLTGEASLGKALDICFKTKNAIVVVKYGKKGASAFTKRKEIKADPLKVKELDPTGAGDTFAGAFLAGYLLGWPLETCLERANIAGASAVTRKGPMEGTIKLADIDSFKISVKG